MRSRSGVLTVYAAAMRRWLAAGLLAAACLAFASPAQAQFTVTNNADSGAGSLRAAITAANAAGGTPTITFSTGYTPGASITLSSELPFITSNVTINGNGLNPVINGNSFRPFLIGDAGQTASPSVADPNTYVVTLQNLSVTGGKAQGGNGVDGGGGGAGLGGAVLVTSNGALTLTNVSLTGNQAKGGAGGAFTDSDAGGGGGMGGNGGNSTGGNLGNGGGGLLAGTNSATGSGTNGGGANGGAGAVSVNSNVTASPGGFGGGGGGARTFAGATAGAGGFGGGGGGADGQGGSIAGNGGYGGGGGPADTSSATTVGGNGGFGGGGGGSIVYNGGGSTQGGSGGFGAGAGSTQSYDGGGGGLGAGGAVYVQSGGSVSVTGSLTVNGNSVSGGSGGGPNAGNGSAFGGGIFFQSTMGTPGTLSFGAGAQSISDVIADYLGSGGTNPNGGTQANDQGGSLALAKTGSGTLTLSAANTYSGGTTISGGTLLAAHASGGNIDALGSGDVVLNGGTLQFGVNGGLNNNITFNATTSTVSAGANTVTINSSVTLAAGATAQFGIAGDTGTLISNAFWTVDPTATVVVAGGTLKDQNNTLVGLTFSAASTTVNSGATLDFNDSSNQAIHNLGGSGSVVTGTVGSTVLSIQGDQNVTNTFGGVISGPGGVLFVSYNFGPGPTTMILTGDNTYTGGTEICSCTTVQLGNGQNTGSIVGDVLLGGTLIFDRSGPYTFAGAISDDGFEQGKLVQNGTGTVILTGANSYSGGTTVNAGILELAHATNGVIDAAGYGTVTLKGGELRTNVTGTSEFANGLVFSGGTTANPLTSVFAAASGTTVNLTAAADAVTYRNHSVAQFGTATDNGTIVYQTAGFDNFFGSYSVVVGGGTLVGPAPSDPTDFNTYNFTLSTMLREAANVTVNTAATLDLTNQGFINLNNLSGGGLILTGPANAVLNGTPQLALTLDNHVTTTWAGIISGAGEVSVSTNGSSPTRSSTMIFTGANTYTGGTFICSCATLQLGNGGTSGSIVGDVNSDGGIFAINRSDTYTFGGVISGTGSFQQNGTGKTILTADSTYTGPTSVNAGTLQIDGSIKSSSVTVNAGGVLDVNGAINGATTVTINNGGALTGTGTVDPVTVSFGNGATFAPGTAGVPGTSMTIAGNLALSSGAAYLIYLNPTTSSFANVTGNASLGGATVNAIYANGSYVAKQYTILTAGSITGAFNNALVNTNLPSNFHETISYDTALTTAYLNLILTFAIPTGLNGNQQNVGNALTHYFNSNGGIPTVFATLSPGALSQTSGETATGTQQATFDAMDLFLGLLTDPFSEGRNNGTTASATPFAEEIEAANAYAAKDPARSRREREAYAAVYRKAPVADIFSPSWNVWAAAFGGSQTTGGNVALGSNDATSRVFGTAVGVDYRFSPTTIAGFAMAGGGTSFSVNGFGTGRSDLFQAGGFVRHTVGPAYFTAALAYGWQDITTNRTVTIAGIDQLQARFRANAFSGRIEDGYRFATPWMGVTPYAAAQFTTFDLPAYAEQAIVGTNTFALSYAAKSPTDARSEIGLRTDKSWALTDSILTLRGRVAWAHDYDPDRSIAATFQTLPGASFVVNGAAHALDSALTTASAEIKWMNGWSAAATFEGEFSSVTTSYAGKGVVRYAW